jgi:YHS domain-containing protein
MVSPQVDVEPAPVVAKKAAPVPAMAEKEPSEPAVVAATQPPAKFVERSPYMQSKYEQIASRAGSAGLKGFCPVRLRDHRDLSDGLPAYRAEHNGRTYQMSSAEALGTFLSNPDKYVPVANGYDVVQYGQAGEKVEGSLDNSAWFKGRLFLFASPENKDTFVANPKHYATSKEEAK